MFGKKNGGMGVLWLNSGREVHQLVSFRGLYFSYLIFSFFIVSELQTAAKYKKESDLYSIIPELRSKYMESKLPSSLQELVPHTLNKTSLEILHQNGDGWIVASGYEVNFNSLYFLFQPSDKHYTVLETSFFQ